MITTRIYSQRDWRWWFAKVNIDYIHNVGCTTTCLTSLLFVAGYDLTLVTPELSGLIRTVDTMLKRKKPKAAKSLISKLSNPFKLLLMRAPQLELHGAYDLQATRGQLPSAKPITAPRLRHDV